MEVQFSPVMGICVEDVNGDGKDDILVGGNFYRAKLEVGRYDASYGLVLLGDGRANFSPVHQNQSGWRLEGEVRDIMTMIIADQKAYLVARNNDSLILFTKYKNP